MATRILHVVYENQHLKQSTKQQKKKKVYKKTNTHTSKTKTSKHCDSNEYVAVVVIFTRI